MLFTGGNEHKPCSLSIELVGAKIDRIVARDWRIVKYPVQPCSAFSPCDKWVNMNGERPAKMHCGLTGNISGGSVTSQRTFFWSQLQVDSFFLFLKTFAEKINSLLDKLDISMI